MLDAMEAKLKLMQMSTDAAADLVGATIIANGGKMPDGTPVKLQWSGTMDKGTQDAIQAIYELSKSEFWGFERALQDETGVWPDPIVAAAAAKNPAAALAGLGSGQLAGLSLDAIAQFLASAQGGMLTNVGVQALQTAVNKYAITPPAVPTTQQPAPAAGAGSTVAST